MGFEPDRPRISAVDRTARFGVTATSLALLSDRQLASRVDRAAVIGSGIGGRSLLLDVEGTPVFVKRVPLTDLERRPDNVMSTANLFQLPPFYQYGIGSTGFGAWRELAAHTMTTNWVLTQRCEGFPMLYHWRTLPEPPPEAATSEQRAERERTVAYWDGSTAVFHRLEAISQASASIVLFLEYIPQSLASWLSDQVVARDDGTDVAIAMVDQCLTSGVALMNGAGLFHFDAHFENILTDGQRLYFADLGLATSPRFDLSDPEADFLAANRTYDACYVVTHLANWLMRTLTATGDRNGLIRRYAEGGDPEGVGASAAAIIKRYGRIALVMNEFYRKLQLESRTTPYPADELQRVQPAIQAPLGDDWPRRP